MSDFQNKISNDTINLYTSGEKKIDASVGQYFSQGWEIFQKNMGGNLLNGVVLLILNVVGPFMQSGYFMGLYQERTGGKPMEVGQMFKGFDVAGKIVWYYLISLVLGMVIGFIGVPIMMAFMFAADNNPALGFMGMGLFYLFVIVASVILMAFLIFSIFLMTFSKLEGMEAIKASVAIARKNMGKTFSFALIMVILNIVGAMMCYVGAFVTMPVGVIALYLFCNDVFSVEQDLDVDPIDHLV